MLCKILVRESHCPFDLSTPLISSILQLTPKVPTKFRQQMPSIVPVEVSLLK